jgi:hypothetical protein
LSNLLRQKLDILKANIMEMEISYIRYSRNNPTNTRIQLEIECNGVKVNEIISNHYGMIDTSFIENLQNIVDILEEQNIELENYYKKQ